MASIIVGNKLSVDYGLPSGEPREVEVDGEVIYRSMTAARMYRPPWNVAVDSDSWRETLAERAEMYGLNRKGAFGGYRAIAYWLDEQGLLPLAEE